MAEEEEMLFDPNMKKKKKTKKAVDFNLEDETPTTESGEKLSPTTNDKVNEDDLDDLNDLMNLKKKKKPKKKAFNLDEIDNAVQEIENDGSNNREASGETGASQAGSSNQVGDEETFLDDEDLEFNMTKKKKKKKRILDLDSQGNEIGSEEKETDDRDKENENDTLNQSSISGTASWLSSDADYTYDELLQLVFSIIKEKNPDIMAGEKKRLVMRPPQVLRVGTKKTSFANFLDICKSLHRQPRHMQAFLLAELGTSGSVDANNQLIIKGRFQQKQIESVLKRYIKDYVACQTCRSPETILSKDTRLFFLQCESCGSRRSVASIKSGFQAVTGKRAALRAKDVKTI